MNRRDTVRPLLALDTLDAPPSDPIRGEAILINARDHAEQLELEAPRTRLTAN